MRNSYTARRPEVSHAHRDSGPLEASLTRAAGDLLQWLRVECPLCGGAHSLVLYRQDLELAAGPDGRLSLERRLAVLAQDRPLVRCPTCVVRWGGEASPEEPAMSYTPVHRN